MIRFKEATNRNTKCYSLDIGDVSLVISYETVIAASCNGEFFRRTNTWGRTTQRHMKETGISEWPEVDEKEFEARLKQMLFKSILARAAARLA